MSAVPAVDDLLITAEGMSSCGPKLEELRTEGRRDVRERLREARADGHIGDNPALFDVFEEQALLERRIAVLEGRLAVAQIAEPNGDGMAGIGSSVGLHDLETGELVKYKLVGAIEGNVGQGRVSVTAPVGRALFGAAAGAVISVDCPRGKERFRVISVSAAAPGSQARKAV